MSNNLCARVLVGTGSEAAVILSLMHNDFDWQYVACVDPYDKGYCSEELKRQSTIFTNHTEIPRRVVVHETMESLIAGVRGHHVSCVRAILDEKAYRRVVGVIHDKSNTKLLNWNYVKTDTKLLNWNYVKKPAVLAPTAVVLTGTSLTKLKGCVIHEGVHISRGVLVQEGTILNTRAILEHDVRIGYDCFVGPGAVLCGNVSVGNGTRIGAGAVIRPGVTIGVGCRVDMGAIVTEDMPDRTRCRHAPSHYEPRSS